MRWCTAEAPAPRPAYHSADEAYPGLRRRPWCRLYRLMAYRGLLDDEPALRLARYLTDTDTVGEDGVVADVPAMLRGYAARCHVSIQTGYADLRRLVERGLVRQLQGAAPGIKARYRLSFPAAVIAAHLPGLPPDLARAVAPGSARAPGSGPRQADGTGDPDPDTEPCCGELDTSPSTHEGSPPSRSSTPPSGLPLPFQHHPQKTSTEERDQALSVLSACRREWQAQRGRGRVPGPGQLDRLVPLVAVALRHLPPGEVTQILTWHVASARNLPGALAWRLGRVIDAHRRRARHIPADEDGTRDATWWARPGNSAPSQAAAELRRLRQRLGPGQRPGHWRDPEATAAAQAAASRATRTGQPAPCHTPPR